MGIKTKEMKRIHLYRCKRLDNGQWVEGSLIGEDVIVGNIVDFEEDYFTTEFWYRVDPETVGQLWLKVGELKLFEGDIFEFTKHNVRFVVKYNEKRHQFCIAHPDELGLKYFNPWQCPDESWIEEFMKDAVLIGNIYDNKDLLK